MLLKLVDGGIENIRTDEYSSSGCETCDFGSQYVNEFQIILTKYEIKMSITKMYEYAITSQDTLDLFLPHIEEIIQMTEFEFVEWCKKWIYEKAGCKIGEEKEKLRGKPTYGVDFYIKELKEK